MASQAGTRIDTNKARNYLMKGPDLGVLGLDRLQAFASLGEPRIGTVRCLRGEAHGGPITSTSLGVLVVGACV